MISLELSLSYRGKKKKKQLLHHCSTGTSCYIQPLKNFYFSFRIFQNNFQNALAYLCFNRNLLCNIFICSVRFALNFNISQSLTLLKVSPASTHTNFFQHLTNPGMVMLCELILHWIFSVVSRQCFL